jgi:hypothetical protein
MATTITIITAITTARRTAFAGCIGGITTGASSATG